MEPVWTAIFGFWLAGDRLGAVGWMGAALIMAGIVVAEPSAGDALRRLLRRSVARDPVDEHECGADRDDPRQPDGARGDPAEHARKRVAPAAARCACTRRACVHAPRDRPGLHVARIRRVLRRVGSAVRRGVAQVAVQSRAARNHDGQPAAGRLRGERRDAAGGVESTLPRSLRISARLRVCRQARRRADPLQRRTRLVRPG